VQIIRNNAAFDPHREKLLRYFSREDLFFARNTHLCLVCGASGERSLRSSFLKHLEASRDHRISCLRAEALASEWLRLAQGRGPNSPAFVRLMAETVDSVLIFAESPASFTELGYFSAHDEISRKCLVVMPAEHRDHPFIALGPIRAISRRSIFDPPLMTVADPSAVQMDHIVHALLGERAHKRAYRQRFKRKPWKDYDSRQQLALIDEIVDLVGAVNEADLQHAIGLIFEHYDVSKLRLQLSLLVAAGRIVRNGDGELFARPRQASFFDQPSQENLSVKAAWRRAFERFDPDVLRTLDEVQR